MRCVPQAVSLNWITPNALQVIEAAGRLCYKSESNISHDSAATFVRRIVELGHHSVIEHASASLRIRTNKAISHETMRHRLASYSQESSRYCRYSQGKFGSELAFIEPVFKTERARELWADLAHHCENAYMEMLRLGEPTDVARDCLMFCSATEFDITANFRSWLHIFSLRRSPKAHYQIREVMDQAHAILTDACPEVFADS